MSLSVNMHLMHNIILSSLDILRASEKRESLILLRSLPGF